MLTLSLGFKLIVAFAASFLSITFLIRYAPKLGLVDIPNHRSIHYHPTPRGAGIGIVAGVMVSDLVFFNSYILSNFATFLAIFIVFTVGLLDDHRDTVPKMKFFVIAVAVLLLWSDGIVIDSLGRFFGYQVTLGWLAIPFTMFAVAGFTNALNLSDGLDGLAGTLSIIILSTLGFIGYQNNDLFIVITAASFVAAILAFLWFNWSPAKIFMGDSGSLTLGFVVSLLSIKSLEYIQPTVILFIAAIPILDTIIVMMRRKRTGKSIFSPDKLHLHHVLLKFFNDNIPKTVIFIALLQLLYSMIGVIFSDFGHQRYVLFFFAINVIILYILLNTMISKQNPFTLRKKKNRK